jgi:hypothetical protein
MGRSCEQRRASGAGGSGARAGGLPRAGLVLGAVMATALNGCAADPLPAVTDADGSRDAAEETAHSDGPIFEAPGPVNCVTTVPQLTPIQPEASASTCLFEVSPHLPPDAWVNAVTLDGVDLPAEEYELMSGDTLELTGQACTDYRTSETGNIRLILACHT